MAKYMITDYSVLWEDLDISHSVTTWRRDWRWLWMRKRKVVTYVFNTNAELMSRRPARVVRHNR